MIIIQCLIWLLYGLTLVSSGQCSYTNHQQLCKESSGQGPLTKFCSSQCVSSVGQNTYCDASASDCDSSYTNCQTDNGGGETFVAVNIGTSYNGIYLYDATTSYGPDLNPNGRTDWLTISNNAYCPEYKCAIGTNSATSAYKGVYYTSGKIQIYRTLVYLQTTWDISCQNHGSGSVSSNSFTSQVDCFLDANSDSVNDCSTADTPIFYWPCAACSTTTPIPSTANVISSAANPTYQEYAINGGTPTYYFQKFDSKVCSDTCQAYHYYEVYDVAGSAIHSQVTAQFSIVRETGQNYDTATVSQKTTEAYYHFKIKVIGYNNVPTWVSYPYTFPTVTGNDTLTLRVYCGPTSTTLSHASTTTQYVDKSDLTTPTRFQLPAFSTSISDCFIVSYTTTDSASISSSLQTNLRLPPYKDRLKTDARDYLTESTVLQAPVDIGGTLYVIPTNIAVEADYEFYIWVTSHGDAYGREMISSKFTLIVGCTSSVTVTKNPSFITATINLFVGDALTNVYQFYEPTIDIRSTYCKMFQHDITNILINGVSSTTGATWSSSTCTSSSSLVDSSCVTRWIDLTSTSTQYTMTFQVATSVNGTSTQFLSDTATIVVTCGPSSTTISSSIIEEHLQYPRGTSITYTFLASNFTCTYPACCQTMTYSVVSDAAGITLHPNMPQPVYDAAAGNWYVTIPTSTIAIYDYYIKATNEMGNTVVSNKIRADIHFNCLEDVITLNATDGIEKGITYTAVDGQPVITYSEIKNQITQFTFNIYDRFVQTGNATKCPFTDFRIDYVLEAKTGNNITDNSTFFALDSVGQFTIKKFSLAFTNYQVWISVNNTMIWGNGNGIVGYLLDITIIDNDPYVPPFAPIFSEALVTDVYINVADTTNTVSYKLPDAYQVADTSQIVTVTVNNMESFMTFNPATGMIEIDVSKVDPGEYDTYEIVINLEDENGNTNKYTIVFHVYEVVVLPPVVEEEVKQVELFDWDEQFSARIVNITQFGYLTIQFSTMIREVQNWTWINSSLIDLYIDPSMGREFEENFNASLLNFTWSVDYLIKDYMFIQMNFSHPYEISPDIIQDKIVFHTTPPGLPLFLTLRKGRTLPERYHTLKKFIPKQNTNTQAFHNFQSVIDSSKKFLLTTMTVSILLNIFAIGSLEHLVALIRCLQIMLNLPIYKVPFPAQTVILIKILIKVAMFDIMEADWTTDLVLSYPEEPLIKYEQYTIGQVLDIGYESQYIVRNMESVGIFTILYGIKFILYFLFCFISYLIKQPKLQNYLDKISPQILFRDIFILVIDANTEYVISVFLGMNSQSQDFQNFTWERLLSTIYFPSDESFPKMDGEIVSIIYCYVSMFLLFVLLPTGYIYVYIQDLETLHNNEFQERWGYLYDGMSIRKSKTNIWFYITFLLRRLIFVALAFNCKVQFSLMGLLFLNICMTIHLGYLKPFKSRYLNRIYLFNEYMIGVVSVHMLLFSDYIPDHETRNGAGWSMAGWIIFTIIVNMIFALYWAIRSLWLTLVKYYRIIKHYYNTHISNEENSLEIVEIPDEEPLVVPPTQVQEEIKETEDLATVQIQKNEEEKKEVIGEIQTRKNQGLIFGNEPPMSKFMKNLNKQKAQQPKLPIKNLVKSGAKAIRPLEISVIDEEINSERNSTNKFKLNPLRAQAQDDEWGSWREQPLQLPIEQKDEPKISLSKNQLNNMVSQALEVEKKARRDRVKRRHARRQYSDSDDFDYDSEDNSDDYERWRRSKGMKKNKLPRSHSFNSEDFDDRRRQRATKRQRRKNKGQHDAKRRYYYEGDYDSKGRRKYQYEEDDFDPRKRKNYYEIESDGKRRYYDQGNRKYYKGEEGPDSKGKRKYYSDSEDEESRPRRKRRYYYDDEAKGKRKTYIDGSSSGDESVHVKKGGGGGLKRGNKIAPPQKTIVQKLLGMVGLSNPTEQKGLLNPKDRRKSINKIPRIGSADGRKRRGSKFSIDHLELQSPTKLIGGKGGGGSIKEESSEDDSSDDSSERRNRGSLPNKGNKQNPYGQQSSMGQSKNPKMGDIEVLDVSSGTSKVQGRSSKYGKGSGNYRKGPGNGSSQSDKDPYGMFSNRQNLKGSIADSHRKPSIRRKGKGSSDSLSNGSSRSRHRSSRKPIVDMAGIAFNPQLSNRDKQHYLAEEFSEEMLDFGSFAPIDAIKHYNSTTLLDNVQTPGTAAKNINQIALKNFMDSSQFKKLHPKHQDLAVEHFKSKCFISRNDYMKIQMKQWEQMNIPKVEGGKLVYGNKTEKKRVWNP